SATATRVRRRLGSARCRGRTSRRRWRRRLHENVDLAVCRGNSGRILCPAHPRSRLSAMAQWDAEPLKDGQGRLIGDLRVSVTDRCNFRCQYCMPAEGLPWLERSELLTFEEIERIVRLLVPLGLRSVRLTGGEPFVRRELPKLIAMLSSIEGL